MKRFVLALVLSLSLVIGFTSAAYCEDSSIIGKWKTIDDETNEPKSIVEIYERDGKYYGKIVDLFRKPGEDPNPVCKDCPKDDPRKDQPIRGMEIIKDLVKRDSGEYTNGTILDPKAGEGKIYTCKIWKEDGLLKVRGYVAFFYRTQTWHKVD